MPHSRSGDDFPAVRKEVLGPPSPQLQHYNSKVYFIQPVAEGNPRHMRRWHSSQDFLTLTLVPHAVHLEGLLHPLGEAAGGELAVVNELVMPPMNLITAVDTLTVLRNGRDTACGTWILRPIMPSRS